MNRVGNRHQDDLRGRFLDNRIPARVIVSVSAEAAPEATAQHITWMLLNLLARQPREVKEIILDIPHNILPIKHLGPLLLRNDDFYKAVREGVRRINPTVLDTSEDIRSTVCVRVGPGAVSEADFSIVTSADRWSGYVGQESTPILGTSQNPIGAYVAASLCAGEIFKFIRGMREDAGEYALRLWFDAYNLKIGTTPFETPDFTEKTALPSTVLAGVGAVANGFLQVLYAFPGCCGEMIAIDGDREGITDTNLNRYVLFTPEHTKTLRLKASTVSEMFADSNVQIKPVDRTWQEWCNSNDFREPQYVISAVDKNSARHAIQDSLPPIIIGASTNEMLLRVNLYDGSFSNSPCLKCRNKIDTSIPDDVVVAHLQSLTAVELESAARQMDVDVDTLREFLADPHVNCGKISGLSLQKFAAQSEEVSWSVGFVSFLAGVLLASEYIKHIAQHTSGLNTTENTFRFQFWRPENSEINKLVNTPPEDQCLCRTAIYQQAYQRVIGEREASLGACV